MELEGNHFSSWTLSCSDNGSSGSDLGPYDDPYADALVCMTFQCWHLRCLVRANAHGLSQQAFDQMASSISHKLVLMCCSSRQYGDSNPLGPSFDPR